MSTEKDYLKKIDINGEQQSFQNNKLIVDVICIVRRIVEKSIENSNQILSE